jgi:hypothetical protein
VHRTTMKSSAIAKSLRNTDLLNTIGSSLIWVTDMVYLHRNCVIRYEIITLAVDLLNVIM